MENESLEAQLAQAEGAASDFYRDYCQERDRREELEVVAAALYLGHDDAKKQFDMYKAVYLDDVPKTQEQPSSYHICEHCLHPCPCGETAMNCKGCASCGYGVRW